MKKVLGLLGKALVIVGYPTVVTALLIAGCYGIAQLFGFLNILQ